MKNPQIFNLETRREMYRSYPVDWESERAVAHLRNSLSAPKQKSSRLGKFLLVLSLVGSASAALIYFY